MSFMNSLRVPLVIVARMFSIPWPNVHVLPSFCAPALVRNLSAFSLTIMPVSAGMEVSTFSSLSEHDMSVMAKNAKNATIRWLVFIVL